jgi:hypothetical protein
MGVSRAPNRFGITTREPVARFQRQTGAKGSFQLGQGGIDTPGKILSESGGGFRSLFRSGRRIAEPEL